MIIQLYFDGCCEPVNPGGIACIGWQLISDGKLLDEGQGIICRGKGSTNNVAEWAALVTALWAAHRYHPERMEIFGDSQLVVNQLLGNWQVRAMHLLPYKRACLLALREIGCEWTAKWIPKEQNLAADTLSREAYRETAQSTE